MMPTALTRMSMLDEKKYMINSAGLFRLYEPIRISIPLMKKNRETIPITIFEIHQKNASI